MRIFIVQLTVGRRHADRRNDTPGFLYEQLAAVAPLYERLQRKVAGQAVRNVGGEGRSRHVAVRHVVEHHAQVRCVLNMHVRFPPFGSLVSLVRWFVGSVNRAIVRIEGGLLKLGRQKQAQPVALASSTS